MPVSALSDSEMQDSARPPPLPLLRHGASVVNPTWATSTVDTEGPGFTELQERLLKKELISRQTAREFEILAEKPFLLRSLCRLPPIRRSPFLESPARDGPTLDALRLGSLIAEAKAAGGSYERDDDPTVVLPVFSFLFSGIILTFPFVHRAGPKLINALDDFLKEMLNSRGGYSSTVERGNALPSSHRKAFKKLLKKFLVFAVSIGIKTPKQLALLRDGPADRSISAYGTLNSPFGAPVEGVVKGNRDDALVDSDDGATLLRQCEFEVDGKMRTNIPTVRIVSYKKHMRLHYRADFVITTTIKSEDDHFTYCVCRSYREFVVMRKQLAASFPALELPTVPPRFLDHAPSPKGDESHNFDKRNVTSKESACHGRPHEATRLRLRDFLKSVIAAVPHGAASPSPAEESTGTGNGVEPDFAAEPAQAFALPAPLVWFLTAESTRTVMSVEEEKDAYLRAKAEVVSRIERNRFENEVSERARILVENMRDFLDIVMQKGGLTRVFTTVAEVDQVQDLPPQYQSVIEWASVNFAFSLLEKFSNPVRGPERLAMAKRVNAVTPYRAMSAIMRWTNPLAIAKGVINLLLKRPPWPGGKSIFQQMVTAGIGDEVEVLDGKCKIVLQDAVEKLLAWGETDKDVAEKTVEAAAQRIRNYVADNERMDRLPRCEDSESLILQVLLHPHYGETPMQIANAADEANGADANLRQLQSGLGRVEACAGCFPSTVMPLFVTFMALESARRDKIAIKELAEHAATAELVKEVVGLFYGPLMDLYRQARADKMIILGACFMKDMITVSSRVVERCVSRASSALTDAASSANFQAYLELLDRHIAGFYAISHALHAEPGSVLGECVRWSDAGVGWLRGSRADLGFETHELDEGEGTSRAAGDWVRTLELEVLVRAIAEDIVSGKSTVKIEDAGSADLRETEEVLMRKLKEDARSLEEYRKYKKERRQQKARKAVLLASRAADADVAVVSLEPTTADLGSKTDDTAPQPQGWGDWFRSRIGMAASPPRRSDQENSKLPVQLANNAEVANTSEVGTAGVASSAEEIAHLSDDDAEDDDENSSGPVSEVPPYGGTADELYFRALKLPQNLTETKQSQTSEYAGTSSKSGTGKPRLVPPNLPSLLSSTSFINSTASEVGKSKVSLEPDAELDFFEERMPEALILDEDDAINLEKGNCNDERRPKRVQSPGPPATQARPETASAEAIRKPGAGTSASARSTSKRTGRPPPKLEVVPLLEEKFSQVLLGGFLT